MSNQFLQMLSFPESYLWSKMQDGRHLVSFSLEITRRCNNNCRHCYINLSGQDQKARDSELDLGTLERIASEAVDIGAVWCSITGGEPLLRPDFEDIYLMLKRKGLLVSVFTNACLVNEQHIALWKKYPPRDIEVSVYGVTEDTYESLTRVPGSFNAFMRGLDLLLTHGIKVRLKAMALRSTLKEMPQIMAFCRQKTKDYFRFDPMLHLRLDGDPARNAEIRLERLTPEEIVALEVSDPERLATLKNQCHDLINHRIDPDGCDHLFHCGVGYGSFTVNAEGLFCLCASLVHPDCVYDLRHYSLKYAWEKLVLSVRARRSQDPEFLARCHQCPMINLCFWCPAHAYLETGKLDAPVDIFCRVAHARAEGLRGFL